MDKKQLMRKMLPGFLPLLVFIVADEIWGTKIGLIVALVFGVCQLGYEWLKNKMLDKFILFDTLLIVALGVVSIVLDNEVFFKLKPALIGVLITVIVGVSAFTPANFILGMSKRYMGNVDFSGEQLKQFTKTLRLLFFVFVIHTSLVFYSVWFMSKEAWAFISGGLFYIMFGIVFLVEFIRNKLKQRSILNEEQLPVLNDKGEVIGKAARSVCHSNKKYLHPVVHLHVFNKQGQLYLQKRSANKLVQPNKWDTAVGGHVSFGDTIEIGLKREAFEELGIADFDAKLLEQYIFESDIERELVFMLVCKYDVPIHINKTELSDGKFWSIKDIKTSLNKGVFTPNFEMEYHKLIKVGLLK